MLTSRFPGEVSGADLPTLTNPAGAGDIAAGKQAIRQDGGVVTGNVPTPNSVTLEDGTVEVGVSIGGGGVFLATGTMASDNLLRAGKTVQVSVAASISIPAPLAGRDLSLCALPSSTRNFNPRAPCGARPLQA